LRPLFGTLRDFIGLAGGFIGSVACFATDGIPMEYRHNAPESAFDRRYEYHWKILETALEKTTGKYGAYKLESGEFMTEQRQVFELKNKTGKLTVLYLGTTPEMEQELIPVRIPVDKNLGGYCVFLTRPELLQRFAGVTSLGDLRHFTFGLGLGWIDVDILRSNRFRVVTGSSYEGLFEMAENGRFDAFLRSATEVIDEYESRKAEFPRLCIEPGLGLYYPMPMYFWFSKTAEGQRLAGRAEAGMRIMIADGSFDRIFSQYQDAKIRQLDLKHRRFLKIANPLLGPETPLGDSKLWFDPATYQTATH
jgi:ABC-type amino acid transport substrate-binding protein